jgi:hypothetical protein
MAPERRNQIVLAVLLVALAVIVYRAVAPSDQAAPAQPGSQTQARRGAPPSPQAVATPDVRLDALNQERAKPSEGERNLFRFQSRAAQASSSGPGSPVPTPQAMPPTSLPQTPSVAPIALKFIGVVEATEQSKRYAVLRDDRGVYHGREGDIIEGRYRILRIGTESIELAYVDGQGRQTIRLGS